MASKVQFHQKRKSEKIDLRMRINNQVNYSKKNLVTSLMKEHNISDFDRGLMLLVRCLNDPKVKEFILDLSNCHLMP